MMPIDEYNVLIMVALGADYRFRFPLRETSLLHVVAELQVGGEC